MSSPLGLSSDTSEIFRPLLCSPALQMDTNSGKACHFMLGMNLSNSLQWKIFYILFDGEKNLLDL